MKTEWNYADPLDEVFAIRRELSAEYGHDLDRIFADGNAWRKCDEAAGFKYVRLPIARINAPFDYPQVPAQVPPMACEGADAAHPSDPGRQSKEPDKG